MRAVHQRFAEIPGLSTIGVIAARDAKSKSTTLCCISAPGDSRPGWRALRTEARHWARLTALRRHFRARRLLTAAGTRWPFPRPRFSVWLASSVNVVPRANRTPVGSSAH